MESYVKPTGRTRYAARVIRGGHLWWKWEAVILVLQIEEFFHERRYIMPDSDGTSNPDRIDQGYHWRDATLEDLATMGKRDYEPTVEDVRRHTRSYARQPAPHVGPHPAGTADQQSDGWPSILRGYPDVPPAGFQETGYSTGSRDTGTQSRTQPPPAPGAGY